MADDKLAVDYTGWLPDCILTLVLENVDPESILKQMTISKRWKRLSQREDYWKTSFFHIWRKLVKDHGVIPVDPDWNRIKEKIGLSWQWLATMILCARKDIKPTYVVIQGVSPEGKRWSFVDGYPGTYTASLRLGFQAVIVTANMTYSGELDGCDFSGYGTTYYENCGIIYEGQWYKSAQSGTGTLIYKDGYRVECQWKKGVPLEEVRHPDVLEKIDRGRCLYKDHRPQYIFYSSGGVYCESCWKNCVKGAILDSSQWFINGCSLCYCNCSFTVKKLKHS